MLINFLGKKLNLLYRTDRRTDVLNLLGASNKIYYKIVFYIVLIFIRIWNFKKIDVRYVEILDIDLLKKSGMKKILALLGMINIGMHGIVYRWIEETRAVLCMTKYVHFLFFYIVE